MKINKIVNSKDNYDYSIALQWGEKIDPNEVSKLSLAKSNGILVPAVKKGFFKTRLEGKITNAVSASEVLAQSQSTDEFLDLFWRLLQCVDSISSSGLNTDKLLTDNEYVFIQKNTGTVKMIYLPVQSVNSNISTFLSSFVEAANVTDKYSYMLKSLDGSIYSTPAGNFKTLMEEVNRLKTEIAAAEVGPIEEPEVDERYNLSEGTVLVFKKTKSYGYFESEEFKDSFSVLQPSFMVGRSANADHVIPGRAVSHMHAEIIKENDKYFIQDQYSTNGTQINGERVDPSERIEIFDGNKVRFADVEYSFSVRWK